MTNRVDLGRITFTDDPAVVELPIEAIDILPLVNQERLETPRLMRLVKSLRTHGYRDFSPLKVRVDADGSWIVEDGGHRIAAARKVAGEWLSNEFGRKVRSLTFLLRKVGQREARCMQDKDDHDIAPADARGRGGFHAASRVVSASGGLSVRA